MNNQSQALPQAYTSHNLQDRLRIKVPSRKGNAKYFNSVTEELQKNKTVIYVEANHLTGGVFIRHSGTPSEIYDYCRKNNLFDHTEGALVPVGKPVDQVASLMKSFSTKIKNATNGDIDMADLAFLSLFTTGIMQLAKGRFVLPPWYTAFWYAFGLFSKRPKS
ncbi:MAG: hypothetical protein HQK88_14730 [Nitrospirae bacterium]|nr:hypothetical protein [Nitrospirota bacterium]MBF0521413.1 hypothetical protein [Nitrospirota bacterium]MBF0535970.1 hypothetical protein [Nitrospirota bacterium]MBF0618054.1 hypothetical protein [Nitrospirota bacterium]